MKEKEQLRKKYIQFCEGKDNLETRGVFDFFYSEIEARESIIQALTDSVNSAIEHIDTLGELDAKEKGYRVALTDFLEALENKKPFKLTQP